MSLCLHFHDDLVGLLRRHWRERPTVEIPGGRNASIKDVVESFGLPHTEVGTLLVNGTAVDFTYLVQGGDRIDIRPIEPPWQVRIASLLRPRPLAELRFLVDANVAKLGRLLRMAGFDTASYPNWSDARLAACAAGEQRLLLSKDRGLLMRKEVEFGRYVRATMPAEQLREIINLLGIAEEMDPLSRCLECNSPLQRVAKEEINHLLEPLTRTYYEEFSRCPACHKIYWPGSHVDKMRVLLADLLPEREVRRR